MTPRRHFLKSSAALASVAGSVNAARMADAAPVHMALIGCGGQGSGLLMNFAGIPGVVFDYVCDPDTKRATGAAEKLVKAGKPTPKQVADLRQVLDDPKINAVVVATPDHWHAPAAILACQAGKHVYVEKPCSHNIREGQLLVAAAAKSGKLVQHGTQSRSMPLLQHAIGHLHSGLIGTVLHARAINIQRRANIGHAKPSQPPEGFDYDMWTGPAPMVPFQANRHHYTWHWWYDFGTGDMGNDGVHELDIARWGLGVTSHPDKIAALGGKYYFDDDQQFPDMQNVLFEYNSSGKVGEKRQLMFDMRIWSPYSPDDGIDNGVAFYGTEGWMLVSKRGVAKAFDAKGKPMPLPGKPMDHPSHQLNLIQAIRGEAKLTAPIEIGHISASLCHMGNIAVRLGRSLDFNGKTEEFTDAQANAMIRRKYREGHWAIPVGV
ncbi:MAG: Gfo/Idh/MocA family protein [bacterium]